MSQIGNIIVFSGSLRDHSINVMLAKSVVNELEREGVASTFLDLRSFNIPLYNGDSEDRNGLPEDLCLIHEQISTARGFIVTSPEYNGFFTPLLKNFVDWLSRPVPDHLVAGPFRRKPVLLMSASPGKLGGIRGLQASRQLFSNVGAFVSPDQLSIPNAHDCFDAAGFLTADQHTRRLKKLTRQFVLELDCFSSQDR